MSAADHKIVVTRDERGLARLAALRPVTEQDRADYYAWRVVCSDPAGCPGWVECTETHEVDDDPWGDFDRYLFHGVMHDWRAGYGWTVDYAGCPVEDSDTELPDGIDTTVDDEYPIEVEWDDELCVLIPKKEGER